MVNNINYDYLIPFSQKACINLI
ncbi:hypothetical protein GASC598B02_002860, partial [Gilliamella apicola SCGC AB-598-B02]